MKAQIALSALLFSALLSVAVRAQSPVGASAALFDKGLKDMLAGQYAKGCPELAESMRLDPEPGTLFTLAECQRKQGKLATAAAHYDDYLRLFNNMTPAQQREQHGRNKVSKQERAAIAPLIPKLTLRLPQNAPPTTVVKLNGKRLDTPSLGVPLPVDPGTYTVTTQVPGGSVHQQQVSVDKGENNDITLEVDMPSPQTKSVSSTPLVPPTKKSPEAEHPRSSSSQRTWAYVIGGVGVAGVITGGVAGALALGKKSTVSADCNGSVCTPAGKQAADSGQTLSLISTVGFGVGAAGLITGAILLFTAPNSKPAEQTGMTFTGGVGASGAWLGAEGRW